MNYWKISKDDMVNGDGIRVVLWVAGCSHNCYHCQNPFTHNPNGGKLFTEETFKELCDELDKDYISGITLSGGDPLFEGNRAAVEDIVSRIKEMYPEKDIWLYTGYKYEQVKDDNILKYVDVLVDGKYVEALSKPSPKWCGSTNQHVIRLR